MSTFLVHLSTSVHQGDPNLMTDDQSLDPELAARLRAASEQRIAEQIQAARTRADEQRAVRADFAARRTAGLRNRYAAKQARLRMIANHNSEEAP